MSFVGLIYATDIHSIPGNLDPRKTRSLSKVCAPLQPSPASNFAFAVASYIHDNNSIHDHFALIALEVRKALGRGCTFQGNVVDVEEVEGPSLFVESVLERIDCAVERSVAVSQKAALIRVIRMSNPHRRFWRR